MAVALRLIEIYGSPSRALSASRESLEKTLRSRTDLAGTIAAARELAEFREADELQGNVLDPQDARLLAYLRRSLAGLPDERLFGVFLDGNDRFIAAEWLAYGTRASVDVTCRALVARILDLGARGLVLAHNHPSGNGTPSDADRKTTAGLNTVLNAVGCRLLDHLILTTGTCYSMSRAGDL